MPAYKDKAKGTWYASFYFENWTGKKEKKMKRGFKTKREALEWERTFLQQQTADLDMTFESFVALYATDMKGRIKENMEVNKTKSQNSPTLKNSQKFVKWGQWFNTRSNSEKVIIFEITDFSMYGDFLPKIDASFL